MKARGQGSRQQIRDREEPPLAFVQHVDVLDALVDLAVLQVAEPSDQIEAVEREVFDIVAVQVDRFLPKFRTASKSIKKMQFSLLRTALETHPEEVAEMVNAFVGLPASERKLLSDLLKRTTLSNIIRATKIVDDRLLFLRGLEEMLADPDLRAGFLEREHLHELLAKNTWIFGDAYALTASDESLTEAVRRHVEKAKLEIVVDEPILQSDGRQGRVDLMLTRALGAPAHSREHIVIELKRPTVTGGEEIVGQVKKYARALAADPAGRILGRRGRSGPSPTNSIRSDRTRSIRLIVRVAGSMSGRITLPGSGHGARCSRTVALASNTSVKHWRFETKKEAGVRHLQQNYADNMPEIVETKKNGRVKQASVKRTRRTKKRKTKPRSKATNGRTPSAAGR